MGSIRNLDEVIRLVNETGERIVVVTMEHDPVVILDLATYRSLLDLGGKRDNIRELTEGEFIDRINLQIAEWREGRKSELDAYDVSQFQISALRRIPRESVPSGESWSVAGHAAATAAVEVIQPSRAPLQQKPLTVPNPEMNLPVVADDEQDEYRLEPLV